VAGVSESPSVNDKMSVGTSFTFGNLKGKKTEEAINDQPIEPPKNSNSNDTDPMSQICPKLFVHKHLGSINDNYRMGKTLGEGAFGKVCLVTHKPSEMVRAMKMTSIISSLLSIALAENFSTKLSRCRVLMKNWLLNT